LEKWDAVVKWLGTAAPQQKKRCFVSAGHPPPANDAARRWVGGRSKAAREATIRGTQEL
jgi:hypothetical protein